MENCIFCKIASGAIPSAKVFENENIIAFLDASPMSKGHFLVVPKEHWQNLATMPASASATDRERAVTADLWRVVRAGVAAAVKVFGGGANVLQCTGVEAGQTVFHLHIHVIPRAAGCETPPQFSSGAFHYASDEERDETAASLRKAMLEAL